MERAVTLYKEYGGRYVASMSALIVEESLDNVHVSDARAYAQALLYLNNVVTPHALFGDDPWWARFQSVPADHYPLGKLLQGTPETTDSQEAVTRIETALNAYIQSFTEHKHKAQVTLAQKAVNVSMMLTVLYAERLNEKNTFNPVKTREDARLISDPITPIIFILDALVYADYVRIQNYEHGRAYRVLTRPLANVSKDDVKELRGVSGVVQKYTKPLQGFFAALIANELDWKEYDLKRDLNRALEPELEELGELDVLKHILYNE